MVYPSTKLAETGTAEFQHKEEVRISHDTPDNMIPTGDYYRQKEIDSRTAEAMAIAAQNGVNAYVTEGTNEIDQYLQQYAYIHGVGERMEFWRKSENA